MGSAPDVREIRWGMIGCGDVAEVKSGPGFYKARNSRLVAVMRRDGALAEDFARRHNVPRWHTDADAIIEADDVDAVYIATRPDTHASYALRCAAAGKPVYLEKPMALRLDDCIAIVEAFESAGVPLWVAHYRRKLERFLEVKRLIDGGAIGVPLAVNVRHFLASSATPAAPAPALDWRRDVAQGGGLFVEAACHTLDIMDFYFGPIGTMHAVVANRTGASASEDVVAASMRFGDGMPGAALWCFAAGIDDEYCEVVGSTATLRFSMTRAAPIEIASKGAVEQVAVGDPEHVQQPMIQSIVDELNGTDECPSTGRTALRTARVMDAAMREFRARA